MKKILFALLMGISIFGYSQSNEELITRIKNSPADLSSLQLLNRVGMGSPNYDELNKLFKGLDKKVRKSNDGKYFQRYLDALKSTLPGKKAPGITQFNIEGEPYSLQDLKGKYVLVSFWATWNSASRSEIPLYKELYTKYKEKGFEILGVSYDSDFDTWKNFVQQQQLDWKHISDLQNMNNGSALVYGIKSIPQHILVDPNGIIIARNLSGDDLKGKLAELLQEKPTQNKN